MRQIITPLPKLPEPETSPNLTQSVSPPPPVASVNMDSVVPYPPARRHSLSTLSVPPRRSPESHRVRPARNSSHPLPTPSPIAEEPNMASFGTEFPSRLFETATFQPLGSSLPQSTSSSPGPSRNYAFTAPETFLGASLNPTPKFPASSPDDADSAYITFFLQEVPALLPFSELFPNICNDMWAISLSHVPLSQAILAISSYLSDRRADVPPVVGLSHLETALTRINEAISIGIVDAGLIASVFLLALLSTLSADYKGSRRHLQGLSQLFQCYQQRWMLADPSTRTVWDVRKYSIVKAIIRMAIRMEYHVAFYNHGQGAPIFPIDDGTQEAAHADWLPNVISKTLPNGINWALASFALDDLMNRAGHLSHKLDEDGVHPLDRSFRVHELVEEHQNWKTRPIISEAMIECLSPPPNNTINPSLMHTTSPTFLHYPPVTVRNNVFATLLIRHFMIGIYLSLIGDPRPGAISPARFQNAVDICRYFVTLYGDPPLLRNGTILRPVDNCMAIITAGFTFQDDAYPQEFDYCIRTLTVIAQETGFSSLMDVVEILKATHRNQVGKVDWAREFQEKIAGPSPGLRWDYPNTGFGADVDALLKLVN